MGTSGIFKALVKDTKASIKSYQNGVIVELENYATSFTAFIDESCLGRNTVNPKKTLQDVKWLLVREHIWHNFKTLYPTLTHQEFFNKLTQECPDITVLEGNNSIITSTMIMKGNEDGELRAIYLLMPYSVYPEYEGVSNIRTVVLGSPKILYCHFKFPKDGYIPLENSDKKAAYGQTVDVEIYSHLLPDWRANGQKFDFEVELINKGEAVAKSKIIEIKSLENYSYNVRSRIKFLIDTAWQENHNSEKKNEEYFLKLKGKIGSTQVVYMSSDNQSGIIEYDSQKAKVDWMRMEKGKWVFNTSRMLLVPYDTITDMMSRFEVEKTNMIQYIGDINYSQKENNPCAFSVITVNDGKNNIEIFNESKPAKPVNDKSKRFVDIVCGDKETKAVKVTAKFINKKGGAEHVRTNKNGHMCEMILNDGKKHNGLQDVFKMGWILGQWVPSEDPQVYMTNLLKKMSAVGNMIYYHPSNALSSPLMDIVKTIPDQDAKGTPPSKTEQKKYESLTVAQVQRLTDNDYKIDEDSDSITLNLKYNYNKSYENEIANYLLKEQNYLSDGILNDNIKNLWVVRYLLKWIKGEPMEQTYFVPVTTCRYPNQIAKIRVFPDMKWVFNFNYNIDTPIYYKASTALETYYSGFNEGGDITTSNSTRRTEIRDSNITNILQPYAGRKTSFGISIECEVSGEDDIIKIGKDFAEKFRKMLFPFLWMVNKLDRTFAVSEARNEQRRLRGSGNIGLLARLNKLPMSFELKPPSLGVGLGIGYSTSKNGIITYELDGRIKADPIIAAEVKLDILALGSKLKPWGAIIDALDLVSWATNIFSGGRVELEYKIEVRFYAEIKLVGKQTGTDDKTGEKEFASEASLIYNFEDRDLTFEGGLEGKILGEIEISASVKIKANVKDAQGRVLDEKKKLAEAGIGAKASSYVKLTCPFELNDKGNLNVEFFFSGVKLEVWFKASLNADEEDSEPNIVKELVPKIDLTKEIEF